MDTLPDDVLIIIFKYLDFKYRRMIMVMCHRWYRLIWKSIIGLNSIFQINIFPPFHILHQMTNLSHLLIHTNFEKLDGSFIDKIGYLFGQLETLSLNDISTTQNLDFSSLGKLKRLKILKICNCKIINGLSFLSRLADTLTILNLDRSLSLDERDMEYISQLTKLERLSLFDFKKTLDDRSFHNLTRLTNLTELDISGNNCITDASKDNINKMTQLRSLDIYWTSVSSDFIDIPDIMIQRIHSYNIFYHVTGSLHTIKIW